ncbi:MAG: hypothetical protein QOK44_2208, partial [Betaproteobacteria bacterium]|nr:hypothetical protein [Betaproteobacteria bacterium]
PRQITLGKNRHLSLKITDSLVLPCSALFCLVLPCSDGACPPEDCGGPPGYAHLQRTLAGRMTGARRELLDWLGGPFDPRRFSVAQANARLARIARKAG